MKQNPFNSLNSLDFPVLRINTMKPITSAESKLQIPNSCRLQWRRPWCWERLKAGGEGDDREWDHWMASQTQWNGFGCTLGVDDGQGGLACCGLWGNKELDEWATELNWTEPPETLQINLIGVGGWVVRIVEGANCQLSGLSSDVLGTLLFTTHWPGLVTKPKEERKEKSSVNLQSTRTENNLWSTLVAITTQ